MVKILILLTALLCGISATAQFNDTIHHYFKFSSTGIINHTNDASSYVLTNAVTYNVKKKKAVFNTSAAWVYGQLQQTLTNNDFTAHGDVDFFKGVHKLYGWALVTFDKSYSLKINSRVQAGAGLAYNFIDSPWLRINVSDGFLYEKGDIIYPVLGADKYQIPRNSFRLLYHWSLKDRITLDGTHFFQPSLVDIHDYIIQSWNTITVKVNKWLGITGTLSYNKLSRTNRETFLFTYGVTMEKAF